MGLLSKKGYAREELIGQNVEAWDTALRPDELAGWRPAHQASKTPSMPEIADNKQIDILLLKFRCHKL
jgi:hypothetical protein